MTTSIRLTVAPIAGAVASVAFAVGMFAAPASASADTITDLAIATPELSSLKDAVVAQNLADTLAGPGPFTVFAPVNDAFAELPGYVATALENEPELLTDILLYHVVADDLVAEEVLAQPSLKTVQGEQLRISASDEGAFVNRSEIIATDIDADNGTVHLIDRVLLPRSVYQAAINDLREQINQLREDIQMVRGDFVEARRGH
jgi:transforming growth factor-beta-induced protein